jgi:hypothetical protein
MKKTSKAKSPAPKVKIFERIETLRVLREIDAQREEVTKLLLDFSVTMESDAIIEDWMALVTKQLALVCDEMRMDINDPLIAKTMRKKLVLLAAVVVAWAEMFEEDES